jgi:hypothetical protein
LSFDPAIPFFDLLPVWAQKLLVQVPEELRIKWLGELDKLMFCLGKAAREYRQRRRKVNHAIVSK